MNTDDEIFKFFLKMGGIAAIGLSTIAYVMPQYSVYAAKLHGEAELVKAEQTRQIQVAQAQAELDSAEKRAKAISIIGQAAKQFPEYRTQEFIGAFAESMREGKINQIIYVPTEANIPILERK